MAEENVAELKAEILKLTEERNSALAQLEKETAACVSVSDTLVSTRRIARELKAENERLRAELRVVKMVLNTERKRGNELRQDLANVMVSCIETLGFPTLSKIVKQQTDECIAVLSQEPRNG